MFADDTLLFYEDDQNQIKALKVLLLCFKAVSDLKANFNKLDLVPIDNVRNTRQLANLLGCMVSSLPMNYLGLLLGSTSKALAI